MQEGEPVGIFVGLESGLVHQAADGVVGHKQAPELLLHQLRRLAAEHDLSAAQMRLEFVQGGFYLPALVVEGRQFWGRGLAASRMVVINR